MQDRHKDKERYFLEQARTTQNYVIPYLADVMKITSQTKVLEIGCAEAGNLKPFLDLGCRVTGVDISSGRIELARAFYKEHPKRANLELICKDIYQTDLKGRLYDLIIMRDVIEHIPDQQHFMGFVKKFLRPEGKFFLAFPPWQNPFGGHQQMCQSKILSRLPWIHLLPRFLYRMVLNLFESNQKRKAELLSICETGLSIDRFERILKQEYYSVDKRTLYLINPNYETKFGLKPRKQCQLMAAIPWVRNFFTTAVYYVISK